MGKKLQLLTHVKTGADHLEKDKMSQLLLLHHPQKLCAQFNLKPSSYNLRLPSIEQFCPQTKGFFCDSVIQTQLTINPAIILYSNQTFIHAYKQSLCFLIHR